MERTPSRAPAASVCSAVCLSVVLKAVTALWGVTSGDSPKHRGGHTMCAQAQSLPIISFFYTEFIDHSPFIFPMGLAWLCSTSFPGKVSQGVDEVGMRRREMVSSRVWERIVTSTGWESWRNGSDGGREEGV